MTTPRAFHTEAAAPVPAPAAQPTAPIDALTPYVDFRAQVIDRMRRMASNFVINSWEARFADPLAPHSIAWLYWRYDPNRQHYFQLGTAWQLWLARPEVRELPQLLFSLHQQFAPRAAGPGFDMRNELAVGHDEHMQLGTADWSYAGLAVLSLDTKAGTWEQTQKHAADITDVPAVIRVVLTDRTVMVCQRHGRKRFNDFHVTSTEPLVHGTARAHVDWGRTDLEALRSDDTDRDILRWAIELSDTLSQADNGRIDAQVQAAVRQAGERPGHGRRP